MTSDAELNEDSYQLGYTNGYTRGKADEKKKIIEITDKLEIYKGLISKVDAWRMSGDELCEFIENELKKWFKKQLSAQEKT